MEAGSAQAPHQTWGACLGILGRGWPCVTPPHRGRGLTLAFKEPIRGCLSGNRERGVGRGLSLYLLNWMETQDTHVPHLKENGCHSWSLSSPARNFWAVNSEWQ